MAVIIKLKSHDHEAVEKSAAVIHDEIYKMGVKVIGPIPLPVKNSYCLVNNSPHVDKRSMTKICISKHSRLLIANITEAYMKQLSEIELAPGIELKLVYKS